MGGEDALLTKDRGMGGEDALLTKDRGMGGEDALPCKSFVTSFEILVNFIWFDWSGGGGRRKLTFVFR